MPPRKFKNLREDKPAVPSLDPVPAYPEEVVAPVEPEVGEPYALEPINAVYAPTTITAEGDLPPEVTVEITEVPRAVKAEPVLSESTRLEMEAGRATLKKYYRGAA
jgi:hypothetical protein